MKADAESDLRRGKVLITGGAGFIGSELVRQMAAEKMDVSVVDNLVNGKRSNIEDVLGDRVRLLVHDVRDEAAMRQDLEGVDIVFHLACLGVRHSIHSPWENHQVNAEATLRLLALSRELGVRRFVYVSTSEVYGSLDPVLPMTEKHHTFPFTVYGASKLAGECYARAYHRTYSFPTTVIRPFNAYGPRCHHEGDSGEVIPRFMLRCMAGRPMVIFGDGSQTRDFTYVSDTARGIMMAGFSNDAVGMTINLGSGKEISIATLAQLVAEVSGRADAKIVLDPPRPGDVEHLRADITKAVQLLGYRPAVPLRDGLRNVKAWYESQPESPEELLKRETVRNWEAKMAFTDEDK